jgi:hypothetical protein
MLPQALRAARAGRETMPSHLATPSQIGKASLRPPCNKNSLRHTAGTKFPLTRCKDSSRPHFDRHTLPLLTSSPLALLGLPGSCSPAQIDSFNSRNSLRSPAKRSSHSRSPIIKHFCAPDRHNILKRGALASNGFRQLASPIVDTFSEARIVMNCFSAARFMHIDIGGV